ncbi:hypothetical protein DFH06DRAFT_1337251 [Mycena polygramma]|nr:hypothetical protein DFH06DRAFT_1337251 [Mycena polygramma]
MPQTLTMKTFNTPDFGREPRLGVYHTTAMHMLRGTPYDRHWADVFRTLDIQSLFQLSLRSRDVYLLVSAYAFESRPRGWHQDELSVGGPRDSVSKVPVEVLDLVLACLSTADKINLARVSKKFQALCARNSQEAVGRLLLQFRLKHADIQFMQTATRAVIAGHGVSDFMSAGFHPGRIDFYVPDETYAQVIRFLEVATGYEGWPEDVIHDHPNVQHRTSFHLPYGGPFFCVNQSCSDSAMDCVPYLPFSHLITAVTGRGVWFAYPDSTAAHVSLPNRDSLDLTNWRARDRLHYTVRDTVGSYRISFNLPGTHVCGTTFECPVTSRFATDDGCFELHFPAAPLGCSPSPSVYPDESVISWSLGGRRCAAQGVARPSLLRWRDDGYSHWKDRLEQIIRTMCWARLQEDLTSRLSG